jgi:lipopolysaccharide transport system ATP-binding protein
MSNFAVKVENLSKLYRIGARQEQYATLRSALVSSVKHIIKRPLAQETEENTIWALKDVSFEVKHGEVVGIIGRNGAGKSTLLKVLAHITEPTQGRVSLQGRVGSLLEVGTGFHPELTGRDNIYLNGAILGMKRAEVQRKFDEIVAFAEIEKFLDTPVKRYSTGMYMRLAFAVAAHLEPEILLVDEVLAVGDAEFQKKCLGKMESIAERGRTVLFVSHSMNSVEKMCKSVILLDNGKLSIISDHVREVINSYIFRNAEHNDAGVWITQSHQYENPWFAPRKLLICGSSGEVKPQPVNNDDEDIWLEIEGYVQKLDPSLTIGYAIYAKGGELLYWSYQTDEVERKWPKLKIGLNKLRCNIPPHFLNEGSYRIEMVGGLHFREWLFTPGINCPAVYLTISGALSQSPLWNARREGLLAPIFQWYSF